MYFYVSIVFRQIKLCILNLPFETSSPSVISDVSQSFSISEFSTKLDHAKTKLATKNSQIAFISNATIHFTAVKSESNVLQLNSVPA